MGLDNEPIAPKELILPDTLTTNTAPTKTGALYISGGKVYVYNGSAAIVVGAQTA